MVKVWGDRQIELHYIKDIDAVNQIPYNVIIVITSQLESLSEELLEIQTKYAKYISIWQITWYTDAPPKFERVGSNIFLQNGSLSDLEEDDSFKLTKRVVNKNKKEDTHSSPQVGSQRSSPNAKQQIPWLGQCLTRPDSTIFDMKLISDVNKMDAS